MKNIKIYLIISSKGVNPKSYKMKLEEQFMKKAMNIL